MTPAEQAEFVRLLKIVDADNGFLPDEESFKLVDRNVPRPVTEVAIGNDKGELLLVRRPSKDPHFQGVHFPGSRANRGETLETTCNRSVRVDGVTAGVTPLAVLAVHFQEHHPFGFPVSILVACVARGPVEVTENVRWYSEVPADILPRPQQHDEFFRLARKFFLGDRVGGAVILTG